MFTEWLRNNHGCNSLVLLIPPLVRYEYSFTLLCLQSRFGYAGIKCGPYLLPRGTWWYLVPGTLLYEDPHVS